MFIRRVARGRRRYTIKAVSACKANCLTQMAFSASLDVSGSDTSLSIPPLSSLPGNLVLHLSLFVPRQQDGSDWCGHIVYSINCIHPSLSSSESTCILSVKSSHSVHELDPDSSAHRPFLIVVWRNQFPRYCCSLSARETYIDILLL